MKYVFTNQVWVPCVLLLLAAVGSVAHGDTFVVQKGEPQKLNAKAGTQKAKKMINKVVIKDPIFHTPQKIVPKKRIVKKRKYKKREALHSFKPVSIDGRRSKPRVKFELPVLDVQRVDENYSFEAREKLLEAR